MNKRFPFLLLVALFFAMNAWAQMPKINFTEYDLPNGLHVILHKDVSTPIVAVTMLYHVGSKNEDSISIGFAHFFEHLMFEGSDNIKRGEYLKLVQNAGGELNANTTFDRTFFYETLPSNQLELGLWLESERLMPAKIDSVGVETQRKEEKEELRERNNTPYGSIVNEVFAHAYKVYPYRWTPTGTDRDINKATIQQFRDFYKTFYVPQNATLSISGDIDIKQTKKWIAKYFTGIPKGTRPIPRPTVVEPPQTKEVRDTVYDNIQLPAVVEAYHIPAEGSKDFYAVNMLTTLLSQGKSSLLQKELVDKEQKAVYAGAFTIPTEYPGLAIMFSVTSKGVQPKDLENAMNAAFDSVKVKGITAEQLEKVRNQIENQFVNKNATNAGIAENLSEYYMYFGNTDLINTEIKRYMSVTREDIQNAAKTYLKKENRVVLYYLPKSQMK